MSTGWCYFADIMFYMSMLAIITVTVMKLWFVSFDLNVMFISCDGDCDSRCVYCGEYQPIDFHRKLTLMAMTRMILMQSIL